MRSFVITQLAANAVAPVYFDPSITPFNVSIGCVVAGTINYSIQHTFDDLMNVIPANATWFNNDNTALVGATTSQDGNYNAPVRGARVFVNSGSGSVKVTFTQAGIAGG